MFASSAPTVWRNVVHGIFATATAIPSSNQMLLPAASKMPSTATRARIPMSAAPCLALERLLRPSVATGAGGAETEVVLMAAAFHSDDPTRCRSSGPVILRAKCTL